jgi:hypothetical protein
MTTHKPQIRPALRGDAPAIAQWAIDALTDAYALNPEEVLALRIAIGTTARAEYDAERAAKSHHEP